VHCIAGIIKYASKENLERRTKMKGQFTRLFTIVAVGLLSVAASVLPVAAQGQYVGHFTLPHQVRWQNADLPAGDYTFSIPSLATMAPMTVTGPNGSVFELAHAISDRQINAPNVLILEQREGTYYVRELDLNGAGVQFNYTLPKQSRNDKLLARSSSSTEQVLIALDRN
jgi:hypothetical protein